MNCPRCGAPSDVLETRTQTANVTRRRQCFNNHRFTTHEVVPTVIDRRQMKATERGFTQRATAWARRQAVRKSTEPVPVLARRLGVSVERVRQLRAEG